MTTKLPAALEQCLVEGARRLGCALEMLEWPNGGKDAPCHEINAVINISYYLGQTTPPFHIYAEGTVADRGRIDLIGFNGETAIALEAKGFGKINVKSAEALEDFNRLKGFSPSLTELAGNVKAKEWWKDAHCRWGILVISSFRDPGVKDAWLADDEADVRTAMESYPPAERAVDVDGNAKGFLTLHRALRDVQRGAARITDAKKWGSGEGWLLWAAIPLPPTTEPVHPSPPEQERTGA